MNRPMPWPVAGQEDVRGGLRGDGGSVVLDLKAAGLEVLAQGDDEQRRRGVAQGVDGVVDEIAQHTAHLPVRHGQIFPSRADVQLHADAAPLAVGQLGLQQRVDRHAVGAQRPVDALDVAIHAVHVVAGLLRLIHLNEAVDEVRTKYGKSVDSLFREVFRC